MSITIYFKYFVIILLLSLYYPTMGQKNLKIADILKEVQKSKLGIYDIEKLDSTTYNGFDFNNFSGTKETNQTQEKCTVFFKDSIIKLIRYRINNKVIDFEVISSSISHITYNAFIYSNFSEKTGKYINGYFVRNNGTKKNYLFLFHYDVNSCLKTDPNSHLISRVIKSDILINKTLWSLNKENLISILELDDNLKPIRRLNIFYNQLISTSEIMYEDNLVKEAVVICTTNNESYKGVDINGFDFGEINLLFMEPIAYYYPYFRITATRKADDIENIYDLWMSNNMWYK